MSWAIARCFFLVSERAKNGCIRRQAMKITKVEQWKVRVPMKPDTVNSPEYDAKDTGLAEFWTVPKFIVRLTTDDGITGIGETGRGCPAEQVAAGAAALDGADPRTLNWHALE